MERIDSATSSFWDFKGEGEYTDKKLLMASPFPIAFIIITYLWYVLKFGPEFMKNRKPYNLEKYLTAYNAAQVAISVYSFFWGCYLIYHIGIWKSKCCCDIEDHRLQLLDGTHYYFLSKVVELLDTVFFVLRKKQKQVSFLHVYHHSLMVIATWMVVKYNNSDSLIFIGTINSLVHIVMYTYYGLSVFPALSKYLWWKKYITIMQLIQFSLMFLHIMVSHAISECKPGYVLFFAVWSNTVLFMYLFGDFYVKSYTKKGEVDKSINADKSATIANERSNDDSKNGLNYFTTHRKLAANIN